MTARWRAVALAFAAAGLASPAAGKGDSDLGRITYGAHCAACHGSDGRGDGPMAEFLTVEVPDLTTIQRDNEGVFPFSRVYRIIEGGAENEVHEASTMPGWGERLLRDTYILHGIRVEPGQREGFVRSRILAVIDHIAGMQEQ
jgi:mono/diheme cytochrome c family protein